MPCTAVYFLNRSTLAALSCSSPVSTAVGPSSSVIAATIDARFSGDRDEVILGSTLLVVIGLVAMGLVAMAWSLWSADEVAAVDDQHVAVNVVRGPAGQEDDRAHQVSDLAPAGRGDVLDDTAIGGRIGAGGLGDGGLEVSRCDGIDLNVAGRQFVAVGLGKAHDSSLRRGVGR